MAYPNPITETGALSIGGDVFEYFKGALLDGNDRAGKNYETWPYFYESFLADDWFINSIYMPLPNLPFNRGVFYDWIDYWTGPDTYGDVIPDEGTINRFSSIGSTRLYTFPEVLTGWTEKNVTDWGKIKTLELGMFGSVGNGGSLTTASIIGSGTVSSRIPFMTRYDMNYLRYGLTRFDSYGSCHPDS